MPLNTYGLHGRFLQSQYSSGTNHSLPYFIPQTRPPGQIPGYPVYQGSQMISRPLPPYMNGQQESSDRSQYEHSNSDLFPSEQPISSPIEECERAPIHHEDLRERLNPREDEGQERKPSSSSPAIAAHTQQELPQTSRSPAPRSRTAKTRGPINHRRPQAYRDMLVKAEVSGKSYQRAFARSLLTTTDWLPFLFPLPGVTKLDELHDGTGLVLEEDANCWMRVCSNKADGLTILVHKDVKDRPRGMIWFTGSCHDHRDSTGWSKDRRSIEAEEDEAGSYVQSYLPTTCSKCDSTNVLALIFNGRGAKVYCEDHQWISGQHKRSERSLGSSV